VKERLLEVVGNQRPQCGVAVLFELAFDEVGTAAAAGGTVGDPHAFSWS
jgi:hypothetical protein